MSENMEPGTVGTHCYALGELLQLYMEVEAHNVLWLRPLVGLKESKD
jgi:hypothetical protein